MKECVEVQVSIGNSVIKKSTDSTIALYVERNVTVGDIRKPLREALGLSDSSRIKFEANGEDINDSMLAKVHDFFQKDTVLHATLSNLESSFISENKKRQKIRQAICEDNVELFNETFKKFSDKAKILHLRLVRYDGNGNRLSFTPLFEAARNGNIEIVKKLLEIPGISIDEKVLIRYHIPAVCSEIRQTPLGIAIQNDNLDVVKLLLSKGANPDCSYFDNPNSPSAHVVNMYKYRMEIEKELGSWLYKNITLPAKKHCDFFKEYFPQDKADKLQVANLIIDVFEGKKNASVLNELNEKEKLAINDGRLKVVFKNIRSQLPQAGSEVMRNKSSLLIMGG